MKVVYAIGMFLSLITRASPTELIHLIDGKDKWMQLGWAVAGVGDMNGDGRAEFIVGEPDGLHGLSGKATVFSGADGMVLHVKYQAGQGSDLVGYSVAGLGDADFDGVPDYAVGAPRGAVQTLNGVVWILSGSDGTPIHTLLGPLNVYGERLSPIGDFDGDGAGDILIRTNLAGTRVVELRSGATGAVLQSFIGASSNASFACSLAGAGDTNGDGFPDVIIGAPVELQAGSATVYSGVDGKLLFKFWAQQWDELLGQTVDGLGDVDGDGHSDLVIGAPLHDEAATDVGLVRVHSGADGAELYRVVGSTVVDWLGYTVTGANDLDLDGAPDLLVAVPNDNTIPQVSGTVRALSGRTGKPLFTLKGPFAQSSFGWGLAAGDVNGDGYADAIVGSPLDSKFGEESGAARVYSGRCGSLTPYGQGCPGAGGFVPELSGGPECGAVAGGSVTMSIANALGGSVAWVVLGLQEAAVPVGGGCMLLVGGLPSVLFPVPLGGAGPGSGSTAVAGAIPAAAQAAVLTVQAFVHDPAAAVGFAASNGLRLAIP